MENGKRSGQERTSSSLNCDVGLGFKPTESSTSQSCKRQMVLPPFNFHLASSQTTATTSFTGGGGDGGGALSYEHVGAVLPKSYHNVPSGGVMPMSGRALFTASQWQELERQNMIHEYMMDSIPVPPQLLHKPPSPATLSQSNTASGLDMRSSTNGSDPEPWRCKRTDGKKWRCSRDVAPDHKYCERHASKYKQRSRKHVEVQSHNTTNDHILQSLPQPLQSSISHFPTMASATPYDQTRCIEWFMRSGSIPVSTCNQQWRQVMPTSSKSEWSKDNRGDDKTVSVVRPEHEDKQGFISTNPYDLDGVSVQRLESRRQQRNGQSHNSFFDPKLICLHGSLTNLRLRCVCWQFIDGLDGISNKSSTSALNKYFSPSLTLSMSGMNGIDEDSEGAHMGIIRMNESNRDGPNDDEILNAEWQNPVSWMNSPPGGPLGEALCLGSANTTKGGSNSPTPHGHGYSNSSSNCTKSLL
ncbi:unnamed protein product [Fraxinus pennsylvanica]|uniref:Growth-regulating factor n=1 Tax=Fraxinus pennsylvanica TaxID=56036 RepID=A0AAD1ZLQ5_9LAMI|nr:unnamed protein product [Fraxinus pennsylvanica]